ncbi:hypothetical protein CVT26_005106 [Gymnopilus dilepis]|uniref:Uncharacterized protein n=1 Tax=Gymnopilus dilepis TaxID=231916 RepID=A0A409Y073_9AGAR|nr:hypothetical protein CVT26_005106 [Gymnopilus dilepis]
MPPAYRPPVTPLDVGPSDRGKQPLTSPQPGPSYQKPKRQLPSSPKSGASHRRPRRMPPTSPTQRSTTPSAKYIQKQPHTFSHAITTPGRAPRSPPSMAAFDPIQLIRPDVVDPIQLFPSGMFSTASFPELVVSQGHSNLVNVKRDHISAELFQLQKSLDVAHTKTLRNKAYKVKVEKQLHEMKAYQEASRPNMIGFSFVNPSSAAQIAKATVETLEADETLTRLRIEELKLELSLLEDALDAAKRKVTEAHRQYGEVLVALRGGRPSPTLVATPCSPDSVLSMSSITHQLPTTPPTSDAS